MLLRRTVLASLALVALTPAAAHAADTDLDLFPDETDNCPAIVNVWQRDSDADGTGDACDDTPFESVDGQVIGGGRSSHPFTGVPVFFSFAIRRNGDDPAGTGRVVDGGRDVRLLGADHFWSSGGDAVVKGWADVDGALERYILEVHQGADRYADRFDIVTGSYGFGNRVEQGNLRVG